MPIVYRNIKGSDLTPNEVDNNFSTLDENKLDKSVLASNNTILVKDDAGNLVELEIDFSKIVGRLATGEIIALTKEQVKGLLEIGISDILTLSDALTEKQDALTPIVGWGNPTGTADKTAFDTDTVTTVQLARRVKALIDNLKTIGLLTD